MPNSNARQSDASTAAENIRRMRNSEGKLLYDLICTNVGAATVYLHVLDSYTGVAGGTQELIGFSSAENLLQLTAGHTEWTTGTPCKFTTTDTLPSEVVAGRVYWLRAGGAPGVAFRLYTSPGAAVRGAGAATDPGAVVFGGNGAGTHTIHVLDWVGPSPVQIPAGSTGALSFPSGRPYEGGVLALASTADDSITLPGAAQTTFEAVYST
jgi:hypothetical protein